jgi:hypothetical protein
MKYSDQVKMVLKPGRKVRDPLNREVTIISVEGALVFVRLAGPYGALICYPASVLMPVDEKDN